MKRIAILLILLMTLGMSAAAEEGKDITSACKLAGSGMNREELHKCLDGRYTTWSSLRKDGTLTIDGDGRELGGLFLRIYERVTTFRVEAFDGTDWTACGEGTAHLTDWYPLPEGTQQARLVNTDKGRLFLAELQVYSPGEKPEDVHSWVDLEKADLMLVSCHPDDELLWFGGLLPTYAGQRGLRVQQVTVVPSTPQRRLELLDGLWHCGVTAYPVFLNMKDSSTHTLSAQYKKWNKSTLYERVTAVIRRFKPEVVVTHDLYGEYGHGGHRATADAVTHAVSLAANADKYKDSLREYGTWQVLKCYVHLYDQGTLQFDWHQPLEAFGGRDGLKVATEALAFHRSQTAHGWAMEDGGDNNNAVFGLYYTAVGPDEDKNDLMEHIILVEETSAE
ncbi:MAG: PIG-L family deacetylase [Clostridia bacterium]|nr:PIG-L family deacetylase [Clostridia bacterium]